MDSLKNQFPNLLLIDGGDTGEGSSFRRAWKTPLLWEGMTTMGYDAISLGERDISDTTLVWLQMHGKQKPFFVTGNITRKNSSMYLNKPYVIVKKGNIKVGIVAAMTERMRSRLMGLSLTPVTDILNTAQKVFARKNVDFRILIYHGLISEAERLAKERTDFDLILLGHSIGRPMKSRIEPGQVPIVGPGDRGRELAWITLKKPFTENPADKIQCTILALGNNIASSPKANKTLEKARSVSLKIFSPKKNTTLKKHKKDQ